MLKKLLYNILFYFIALMLTVLPLGFSQAGLRADILPNFGLCIVYFFAVNCIGGAFFIFIFGLFVSEIFGYPLGLESLLFLCTYLLCIKYKAALLSRQPLSLYIGFALVSVIYGLSKFIILSLHYKHLFDYIKVLMQILTTILFYPAVDLVMGKLKR